MRIKLIYKLLIVNLTIILILVLAMQAINYLSNKELFNSFVKNIESQMLEGIADKVTTEYALNSSWNRYELNSKLWQITLSNQLKEYDPFFKPEFADSRGENRLRPMPFMPKDSQHFTPPPPPPNGFDRNKSKMHIDSFFSRVSLLDSNKKTIINATTKSEIMLTRKIELNKVIIGWLTLNKKEFKNNPATDYYMNKQLEMNYWVGALGVLIATLFSYLLSSHITNPIYLLNDGAKKIANRDFTTQINVKSNDEFKDLAYSVNNISKKLSEYDNQQKQWLMDISHEFRTPLTILDGELEALTDGIIPLNQKAVNSLQEEVTLIMRLVHDLHELSVIDKTAFECQKEIVDITRLVTHQINKFDLKFKKKNIRLVNELSEDSVNVKGDKDRLSQVIQNILKNGLRYIDSQGSLMVSAKVNNETIELCFQDSGPGVPTEALPQLFNRLYRTDSSRNRKTGGAGLGLAICKNIILTHSGDIFATLNSKGGLSINIQLPINS